MKETKNKLKRGLIEPDEENPFELFIASNQIEYCYYKESERILGRTYAMCILQVPTNSIAMPGSCRTPLLNMKYRTLKP